MLSALLKRKVDAHCFTTAVIITIIITNINIAYFDQVTNVPRYFLYSLGKVVIFTLEFNGSRALRYLDVYKNVRLRCYALSCQNI
jgi:hypothetical protein